MKIVLKSLSLRNFKGVGTANFTFSETENFIHGANGTGKTTLFDSFVWCLFGKDHNGRSDYQLKPYEPTGKTTLRAKCEVEAVLIIDGKETVLRRVYAEDWVKPKGEAEEVFKGNSTTPYINDVKVTMTEYNALVAGWCNETVFKSITNPQYFPSLSKDEQRAILFSMAGEITNESVAGQNKDFQELLLEITGVSFDAYRKELVAKKTRLKSEIKDLSPRIDELKRTMPQMPDLEAVQAQLTAKQEELKRVEGALSDVAQRSQQVNNDRMEIQGKINELERQNQQLGFDEQQKQDKAVQAVKQKMADLRQKQTEAQNADNARKTKVESLTKTEERLSKELTALREAYGLINAETLVYDDKAFMCPTCERLLEVVDIEAKQAKLNANFNAAKAKRVDENKTTGLATKKQLEEVQAEIQKLATETEGQSIVFSGTTMKAYEEELQKLQVPIPLTKKQQDNNELINWHKNKLNEPVNEESTTRFTEEKANIQREIDELKQKLAVKQVVEHTNTRISQLEGQFSTLNQELAGLERKEFTLKEFEFAKNTEYEARINRMFEFTKFRLFRQQVDGQIVPECEAMVDGVPYSTLNNAMQYGCGLDIIRTISAHNDKYAPIWIDNREGITEIPVMQAQVINLVVNKDLSQLTIIQ